MYPKLCPPGSSSQVLPSLNSSSVNNTYLTAPVLYITKPSVVFGNDSTYEKLLFYTYIGGSSVIVVVFLLLLFVWLLFTQKYVKLLDFVYNDGHNVSNGLMRRERTAVGGFFSLICSIVLALIWLVFFYSYFGNNISEDRTLVPNLFIDQPITADFNLTLTIEGYVALCVQNGPDGVFSTCSNNIFVQSSLQMNNPYNMTCKANRVGAFRNQSCTINFICTNCSLLSSSQDTTVELYFREKHTYATRYVFTTHVTSGYKNQQKKCCQLSSLYGEISSGSLFFRGMNKPFVAQMSMVQTLFTDKSGETATKETGYHIVQYSWSNGDLLGTKNFSWYNGLGFTFVMNKEPYTEMITISSIQLWPTLITQLLSTTSGIVTVSAAVVIVIEYGISLFTKQLKSKKLDKLMQFREKFILIKSERSSLHSTEEGSSQDLELEETPESTSEKTKNVLK
ncbi:hypothetical protein AKO1_014055, partial [Acrasis kona]